MREVVETGRPIMLDIMDFGEESFVVMRLPLRDKSGAVIGGIGLMPVSYTHLDVYKRQGYKNNPEYAVKSLQAAAEGGADALVLCDTNGGTFPSEVAQVVTAMSALFEVPIGIHAHNDCGMAVANSVTAVENGARHVQGTYIGFGERCGNANLSTIIANLGVKRDFECLPDNQMCIRDRVNSG